MRSVNIFPKVPNGYDLLLHPIAFAGWVGMLVTTLNLLPVAMLDGGHVARSLLGDRLIPRIALAVFSIGYLVAEGLFPMAFLVILMLFFRHPGPMDDVSNLSAKRKLVALGLVAIFVLCFVPFSLAF
jgi:membrane-associated protease RseP (regulator of RpoE activity)